MTRKRKPTGQQPAELQAPRPQVRIVFNEAGTLGIPETMGFINAAYNTKLTWPSAWREYSRIRRSMPEIVQVRQAFSAWARNVRLKVELPDDASDADKAYKDFIESDARNMAGGFGAFADALINNVPFYGWGWWSIVPGRRDPEWSAPDGDDWRSEADDKLIGIRRLAFRDPSTFDGWEYDEMNRRLLGMWQRDTYVPKAGRVLLESPHSLHMTFGDPNNPEGLSPLEAVYRLERIKYGLEVVQGIGFEHAAGYLSVNKTEGTLTDADRRGVQDAARAILTAQEGNFALWPAGIEGEVRDINFSAAAAILEAIKYQGIVALSCYAMQWMALSATTGSGSFAAMQDSSSMAVFTFNAMLDGFAGQYDQQVGTKLWEWNRSSFPGVTKRPRIYFSHIEKDVALSEISQFLGAMKDILPIGDDDLRAIRERVDFLPKTLPEVEPGEMTPERQAAETKTIFDQAMNIYRETRR